MLKKWLPAIILTILAIVLITIKIYPQLQVRFFNDEIPVTDIEESTEENEKNKIAAGSSHRGIKENTFPFNSEEEKERAEKYPDQFYIVEKMYYSWDYMDNAQGEFEISWNGDKSEISYGKFYVDFEKKKSLASIQEKENGQTIETLHVLLKDGIAIRQLPEKNIFTKEPIENNPRRNAASLHDHYIGLFHRVITNSEWFILIYDNYTDWKYSEVDYLEMPAYRIEGTITKDRSESLAGPFSMIVSKETGALLDLKCYGQENEAIFSINVKSLILNEGIPNDVFILDISGNKEVDNAEFNLSGMGNTGIYKPGGVETGND